MKKTLALLATAGMLSTPLVYAQEGVSGQQIADPQDRGIEQPIGNNQANAPQAGGSSGLAEALGVSNTVLAVGSLTAVAAAIGVAAGSSSGSSGTTGTTGPTGTR